MKKFVELFIKEAANFPEIKRLAGTRLRIAKRQYNHEQAKRREENKHDGKIRSGNDNRRVIRKDK